METTPPPVPILKDSITFSPSAVTICPSGVKQMCEPIDVRSSSSSRKRGRAMTGDFSDLAARVPVVLGKTARCVSEPVVDAATGGSFVGSNVSRRRLYMAHRTQISRPCSLSPATKEVSPSSRFTLCDVDERDGRVGSAGCECDTCTEEDIPERTLSTPSVCVDALALSGRRVCICADIVPLQSGSQTSDDCEPVFAAVSLCATSPLLLDMGRCDSTAQCGWYDGPGDVDRRAERAGVDSVRPRSDSSVLEGDEPLSAYAMNQVYVLTCTLLSRDGSVLESGETQLEEDIVSVDRVEHGGVFSFKFGLRDDFHYNHMSLVPVSTWIIRSTRFAAVHVFLSGPRAVAHCSLRVGGGVLLLNRRLQSLPCTEGCVVTAPPVASSWGQHVLFALTTHAQMLAVYHPLTCSYSEHVLFHLPNRSGVVTQLITARVAREAVPPSVTHSLRACCVDESGDIHVLTLRCSDRAGASPRLYSISTVSPSAALLFGELCDAYVHANGQIWISRTHGLHVWNPGTRWYCRAPLPVDHTVVRIFSTSPQHVSFVALNKRTGGACVYTIRACAVQQYAREDV